MERVVGGCALGGKVDYDGVCRLIDDVRGIVEGVGVGGGGGDSISSSSSSATSTSVAAATDTESSSLQPSPPPPTSSTPLSTESDFISVVKSFLLPREGDEDSVLKEGGCFDGEEEGAGGGRMDEQLKLLLDETRDYLDTPDFPKILTASLNQSFSILLALLRPSFFPCSDPASTLSSTTSLPSSSSSSFSTTTATSTTPVSSITELDDEQSLKMPLAAALPAVSRLVNSALSADPNFFVEGLSSLPEMKAFSASIYTGWSLH